jgi:hypothetical protein
MYLAYTYFVCNKNTNQFYYGSRYHNIKLNRHPTEDLWIHYFTSSKNIKKLIEEYGKDSFEFKILLQDSNYMNCYWYEQNLIKNNINNSLCINRHYIDSTTSSKVFSTAGVPCSDETKSKISAANTGKKQSLESNNKRSLKTKGVSRGPQSDTHKKNNSLSKLGIPSGRKGVSISTKGKTYKEIYGKDVAETLLKARSAAWIGKKGFQATGKDNPNAKSITVNGTLYLSMKEACNALGITYYELHKIAS